MRNLAKILALGTGFMLASAPLKAQENELEKSKKESMEELLPDNKEDALRHSKEEYQLYKAGILAGVYLAPIYYVMGSPDVQNDKKLHYFASYMLTFGFGAIIQPEEWHEHLLAGGLALSVGIGKELYDEKYGTGFDKNDLLWDSLGVLNGLALNFLIYGDFKKIEFAAIGNK